MRILFLAPQPFYIDRGTPIDTDILLRALSERGDEVDLVCFRGGRPREYPGLSIHRIRAPRHWKVGPGFSLRKLVCDGLLLVEAWRRLRRRRYDVIHASEEAVFVALLFRVLFGIPYVYDMDSSIAQQMVEQHRWLRPLAPLFDACEGVAIRFALAVAPVCNALADLAEQRGARHLVTLHDISQLPDAPPPVSGELRAKLGIEGLMLMYVGNLEPYQGIDLLLDAFARVRRRTSAVDLVVAGGTESSIRAYRQRTRALGIERHVHFIGPWPAERLAELLAEADILTAPRISGINTPMKIFPYLHSGKPLLATDLHTHTQILDASVAHLAPPEPAGFAAGILALCQSGTLRMRLGRAGRRFVQANHTFDAHRARVDRLYDGVHARTRARRSAPPRMRSPIVLPPLIATQLLEASGVLPTPAGAEGLAAGILVLCAAAAHRTRPGRSHSHHLDHQDRIRASAAAGRAGAR